MSLLLNLWKILRTVRKIQEMTMFRQAKFTQLSTKVKKKDQTKFGIEEAENEETAMCENDDLYEASKEIDHTKLSVEAAETEEIVMCENDDLYEAREEIAEEIGNRRDNVKSKDTNYESVVMEN